MNKNWIISDQGDPINLDFLAKVRWGGDFKVPTADTSKRVYFFHGISNDSGSSGSGTVYQYTSANLAKASMMKVINLLITLGVATDLRGSEVTLTAITPATATAGTPTPIALTGFNLSEAGKITVHGVDMAVTLAAGVYSFTTDPSLTAGTYDVEYTDPQGNAAVLTGGLVLT